MDATLRAAADTLQWVVLGVILTTLVLALDAWRRWPAARPYLAGLLSLAAHGAVFYAFALARAIPAPLISLWSAALRFHSSLYILAMLIMFYVVARHPWLPPGGGSRDN